MVANIQKGDICSCKLIKKEITCNIARIIIDQPPLNILSSGAYRELERILEEIERDKRIRVVIITGAGEKAFCAGGDITEFLEFDGVTGTNYSARNQAFRNRLFKFPRPVIAAINGHALGGGCLLALSCDFRIAAEQADFGLGEINMGILGGTPLAIRMLPPSVAKYLVYTGERISAAEAFRTNLVDQVLPYPRVMSAAFELARKLAEKSPLALTFAKRIMNSCYSESIERSLDAERDSLSILWETEDKNEGVRAFLEKRKPDFKGK